MKNRYLFVGDTFWGVDHGAGNILADLLLVDHAEAPYSFTINSSTRNTLDHLFLNCPREIIGRQAGVSVLCVGWEDLISEASTELVVAHYRRLMQEILHNSHTSMIALTLPMFQFGPESIQREKGLALNSAIREGFHAERYRVVDFAKACETYQQAQQARGELARNIFSDSGALNPLGQMLCARTLQANLSI